jgi:hypothetical protein
MELHDQQQRRTLESLLAVEVMLNNPVVAAVAVDVDTLIC